MQVDFYIYFNLLLLKILYMSRELAALWQQCAARWRLDCHCCDASCTPGEDGLHWRAHYHASLAMRLAERLRR